MKKVGFILLVLLCSCTQIALQKHKQAMVQCSKNNGQKYQQILYRGAFTLNN